MIKYEEHEEEDEVAKMKESRRKGGMRGDWEEDIPFLPATLPVRCGAKMRMASSVTWTVCCAGVRVQYCHTLFAALGRSYRTYSE